MAISLTYTFVSGTRALASQVNSNFTTLSTRALDKTGDTMTGDLKFTDATYDIGKTGATRPRDIFASRNVVIGGTLAVTGIPTFTAVPVFSAGIGTLTQNLLFTDATYDIGASGATRPRDLFISRNGVIGGTLAVTGIAAFTAAPTVAAGIQFPAVQAASADVNNLDDYEEGTWTPSWVSSGGGSGTYANQIGVYVKVGKKVMVSCNMTLSSKAGFTAGNLSLAGLPFTVNASVGGGVSVGYFGPTTNNFLILYIYITASATTASVNMMSAGGTAPGNLTVADIANNTQLIFTATYQASA